MSNNQTNIAEQQQARDKALKEVGTWINKNTFATSIPIDCVDFSDFVNAQKEIIDGYLESEWEAFVHIRYESYIANIVSMCNKSHRKVMREIELWDRFNEKWNELARNNADGNGCSGMETAQ